MTDHLGVSREAHERLAQERRLKGVREWRDISQQETATALGVSLTNYNRYEKGRVRIPDDVIATAAAYYGVRRGWLRDGELPRVPAAPGRPVRGNPANVQRIVDALQANHDAADEPPATSKRRVAGKRGGRG